MKASTHNLTRALRLPFTVLAFTAAVSLVQAQSFTATDLHPIGGYTTSPISLNDAGTVVGTFYLTSPSSEHAFIWSNGVTTDLGTFGGSFSLASGINATGTVAGFFISNNGIQAFSYSSGIMTGLGAGIANGIADTGTVVGQNGANHAFSCSNGTMTDLGTLGGASSTAYGINGPGTIIVGSSSLADNTTNHAFSCSNGTMTDLGTLGGTNSTAYYINGAGAIVGDSYLTGDAADHAFSYGNGTMTDLGTLGGTDSYADCINNAGVIVGRSETTTGKLDAFIYRNGAMTDLNTLVSLPGITLTTALGINNLGQIIAGGSDGHGYLLTPMSAPVPTTLRIHSSNGYRQPANRRLR